MTIFLLNLAIYPESTRYHDGVVVGEWHYSDVFSSIDKAVATGKKVMRGQLEKIKQQAFRNRDWSLGEISENFVEYEFIVYEFDTDDKRLNDSSRWEESAEWKYNYNGEFTCGTAKDGCLRFPGDEDENAGTLFERGAFVTIADDDSRGHEKEIFVIGGVPGKKTEDGRWENVYFLFCIRDGKYDHEHSPERQLQLCEREIPADHPLQILRKLATGEITVSKGIWDNMRNGRILFDYPNEIKSGQRSWRDIPELYDKLTLP